jgi:hypothetical protein
VVHHLRLGPGLPHLCRRTGVGDGDDRPPVGGDPGARRAVRAEPGDELLADAGGRLRPALVFVLPASAWGATGLVTAQLVDSLPIVPGSAPLRTITDASLSPDAHVLAVRTYAQVYTFATDSLTGRVRGAIPPGVCNIVEFDVWPGEGITWFGRSGKLLLTSEGRDSPMHAVACPMPRSDP